MTLNLSHTGYPPELASAAVSDICAKFTRWLRHQSQKSVKHGGAKYGRPTYQSVIEAPNGITHVHWLVHVPEGLEDLFEKVVPIWFGKVCKPVLQPDGAVHIGPIETVMALSRYCMKGVDPHHAKRCYVRPKEQGVVLGKRVAISRSLGPAARAREQAAKLRTTGSGSRAGSEAGHASQRVSLPPGSKIWSQHDPEGLPF